MPTVEMIARLQFGKGAIDASDKFVETADIDKAAADLASCVKPLTHTNTADCVDGRPTIALADGTTDPHTLETRIAHQLPGGLGLAVTKAAAAADLAYLRDAKNFQQAYELTFALLTALGYEDGGHADCGASKKVQDAAADRVADGIVLATLPAINPVVDRTRDMYQANNQRRERLLQDGFYDVWTNSWHESFLGDKVPHNFSMLEVDEASPTRGHNEKLLFLLRSPGQGFAKNRYVSLTGGEQAFVETTHTSRALLADIGSKITASEEERTRFLLEFDDDPIQVLNQLVGKDMSVFAEAA